MTLKSKIGFVVAASLVWVPAVMSIFAPDEVTAIKLLLLALFNIGPAGVVLYLTDEGRRP